MRVAVIGGGYAGMAAAVTLTQRGVPVTVFEAAGTLGGRARRVETHGIALDNGQHLLIGAYRETLRLIRLVHADAGGALLRISLAWHIHEKFRLQVPRLPLGIGLLAGMLAAQGATSSEKLSALRFMLRQQRCKFLLGRAMSVADLLDAEGESGAFRSYLWEPLCLAALNTPPQQADAQTFLNVLRDGLSGGKGGSDLLLARCDLSALFPEPAAAYVRGRGGEVTTASAVRTISKSASGFVVETASVAREFSHVICALPPHRLAPLAQLAALAPLLETVARFSYQPITTVYLQYPDMVRLPQPLLGLGAPHWPWCFDRGQLGGQPGLIAAVLSAVAPSEAQPGAVLAQRLHETLGAVLPDLPLPSWHQVIAEKRAAFSCEPAMLRPPMQTALKNFYLAGDYVAGDYPATLEGAVRSGVACANRIAFQ